MATAVKYLIIDDSEIDRIVTSRLLNVRLGANDIFLPRTAPTGWQRSIITVSNSTVRSSFSLTSGCRKWFMLSSTLNSEDIARAKQPKVVHSPRKTAKHRRLDSFAIGRHQFSNLTILPIFQFQIYV